MAWQFNVWRKPFETVCTGKAELLLGRKPFEIVCTGISELSQARENEVGHLLHTVHKENSKVSMVGAHCPQSTWEAEAVGSPA